MKRVFFLCVFHDSKQGLWFWWVVMMAVRPQVPKPHFLSNDSELCETLWSRQALLL